MADAQLARISAETLTQGDSNAQLARVSAEVVTQGDSLAQLARISVEVIVPNQRPFVGWGLPLGT